MQITIIAGARPNFMKIASIIDAIRKHNSINNNIHYRLVHTGQHYDKNMSETFFEQLGIPNPDVNLECGGGSQAEQTAIIMVKFEKELLDNPTDAILVVGDVTSTLACSIVAKKLNIEVIHVEAGIRSYDLTMPEEINRMVTDSITDYFFTTTITASNNLKLNGIKDDRIFLVGNTMIDTLLKNKSRFLKPDIWNVASLSNKKYFVLTLHRPANVDNEFQLKLLIDTIVKGVKDLPIIFPVHPRTFKAFQKIGINNSNLHLINPLPYLEFNFLVNNALAVITDSGGITEETTVMHVPCLTLRDSTERPETVEIGTNELIGTNPQNLVPAFEQLFKGEWKKGTIPNFWDGNTGVRIVSIINKIYNK
jgi:UDP-N-acetylglucosamine 2-epimerase (non-hydrolysing)